MALMAINVSSELGTMQYLDERAGHAFFAARREYHRFFPSSRFELTEGDRSRARQDALWNAWTAYLARGRKPPHANLAARPYTSKHNGGMAGDFRSPLSFLSTENNWWKDNCRRWGWHPTGWSFSPIERWHYDWIPGTATQDISPAASGVGSEIIIGTPSPAQSEELELMAAEQNIINYVEAAAVVTRNVLKDHVDLKFNTLASRINDTGLIAALEDEGYKDLDATRREGRLWRLFRNTDIPANQKGAYTAIAFGLEPGDPRQVIVLPDEVTTDAIRVTYMMTADTRDNAAQLNTEQMATLIRLANGTDRIYDQPAAPSAPNTPLVV